MMTRLILIKINAQLAKTFTLFTAVVNPNLTLKHKIKVKLSFMIDYWRRIVPAILGIWGQLRAPSKICKQI